MDELIFLAQQSNFYQVLNADGRAMHSRSTLKLLYFFNIQISKKKKKIFADGRAEDTSSTFKL